MLHPVDCAMSFNAQLKHFGEQEKSEEESSVAGPTALSAMFEHTKSSLLHAAAKHNDIGLLRYLLDSKCDVDARNSSGTTPLLTAVLFGRFEAAKLLLDAGAGMLAGIAANQTPLHVVLGKSPEDFVKLFVERLKSRVGDYVDVCAILLEAGCSLESVLAARDAQLTRAFLDRPTFADREHPQLILSAVLKSDDFENLRVLLQHGSGAPQRRTLYFQDLFNRVQRADRRCGIAWRHVALLVEWEIVDANFLGFWLELLRGSASGVVETLLRCVARVSSANEYRQCLVAQAFGTVDYDVIESALGESKLDYASVRGRDGLGPLHFAAMSGREKNVRFLLRGGADVNARDDQGRVPLFFSKDVDCVRLLLHYGADVQSVDNYGITAFAAGCFEFAKLELMLAHLAMLAARGVPIDPIVHKDVKTRFSYRQYCQQVEKMKSQSLFEEVTVFDALVGEPGRLVRYIRDWESIEIIDEYLVKCGFALYYRSSLRYNLSVAVTKYETNCVIAEAMSCVTGKPVGLDHLAVENVLRFVNFQDMIDLL